MTTVKTIIIKQRRYREETKQQKIDRGEKGTGAYTPLWEEGEIGTGE